MHSATLDLPASESGSQRLGWTHLAFSVGSEEQVDALTERLKTDGFPCWTARAAPGTGTTRAWCSTRQGTGWKSRSDQRPVTRNQ